MWGVVPGAEGRNARLYGEAAVGDLVLFAGQGRFFAAGTVAYLWRNPALAERLWGFDEAGQTWENMYALDGVRASTCRTPAQPGGRRPRRPSRGFAS